MISELLTELCCYIVIINWNFLFLHPEISFFALPIKDKYQVFL